LDHDEALRIFSKELEVYKQKIAGGATAVICQGPFLARECPGVSSAFGYLAWQCNRIAKERGWWDKPRGVSTFIALVHSELSEALEAARDGDDELFLEELADVFIRIFDWIGEQGLSEEFVTALIDKINFNATRPYRHGNKKF
jgi:NTP pyrophosphatase (non-canonical NTP hydrolase)